jgi:hypothetical protein
MTFGNYWSIDPALPLLWQKGEELEMCTTKSNLKPLLTQTRLGRVEVRASTKVVSIATSEGENFRRSEIVVTEKCSVFVKLTDIFISKEP